MIISVPARKELRWKTLNVNICMISFCQNLHPRCQLSEQIKLKTLAGRLIRLNVASIWDDISYHTRETAHMITDTAQC